MKKPNQRNRHDPVNIVIPCVIGGIIAAVGIGVLIAVISSAIKSSDKVDGFIAVPIIFFGLLPIAMGSIPIVMAIKKIRYVIREKKASRSDVECTATLADYKTVAHNGRLNRRFALKLVYILDGKKNTFTTDYLYDINELHYLQTKRKIAIKVDGNFVTVTEPFPDDIYTIAPRFEMEIEFFKQPKIKKCVLTSKILCIVTFILLVVSIILSATLHNALYIIIGASVFVAANAPFAVIIAVAYFKWKKKQIQ